MEKDFIVTASEDRGEAQYGAHRYSVTFSSGETVSMFSKFPVKVGDKLYGHIETVNKGGKDYTNFKFAKKEANAPTPSGFSPSLIEIKNAIMLGVMPELKKIQVELAAISGRQERQMGLNPSANIDDAFAKHYPDEKSESDGIPF